MVVLPFAPVDSPKRRIPSMPTLFRFLAVVGIIAGLVYAGIFALATLVKPQPRDITVTVPQDRFVKQR
jgi:hypothetical protein